MRCLVTGGTGFIGSNLALQLLKDKHDVVITGAMGEQKIPEVKCLLPSFIGIDWQAIGKIDVLFHQAANNDTTLMDRKEMFRANVDSTEELYKRMIDQGCKKIIYASSTAIYGDGPAPYKEDQPLKPLNPYAESKVEMEKIAIKMQKQYPDVLFVGLRYCNVYGPREDHKGKRATMIWQLAQQMQTGIPRIFKHGEQKRDYIYVKDVVTANLLAAKAKQICIVNCGSGETTTFNDIIKLLNHTLGMDKEPEYFDNPYVGKYQDYTECDMTLAKEMLGFAPKWDIKAGIKDYFESGFLVPKTI
ncbi:MAG: NAD-dependent epimerase/dehydratase family protein [Nanoarchaeota archaeon]|nr:NAD-dependent epimerase/dehydratase family protein [Nanoarchaeota archaeon]